VEVPNMFALRPSPAAETTPEDRFRGTMQRWTLTNGERRATVCDYEFCADWSVSWHVVAGPTQGQVGRARQFQTQEVRADVFVIWFATMPGATLTAVVDFRSGTLTGFTGDARDTRPVTGSFRTL
jgi:hypothetical protein